MEYRDRRLTEARETLLLAEQARESARLSGDLHIPASDEGLIAEVEARLRELEAALGHQTTRARITSQGVRPAPISTPAAAEQHQ